MKYTVTIYLESGEKEHAEFNSVIEVDDICKKLKEENETFMIWNNEIQEDRTSSFGY